MEAANGASRHGFAGKSTTPPCSSFRPPPAPLAVPLETFLVTSSCQEGSPRGFGDLVTKKGHDHGVAEGLAGALIGAIGSLPNGTLLNNDSSFCSNLVSGSCKKVVKREECKEQKQVRNSSSSSNADAAAAPANVVKGQWTAEEDSMLVRLVKQHGVRKWSQIAKSLVGRIGKQCRERWHNHLRPDIKKDMWTEEEERQLVEAHIKYGNRWAEIAKHISGRSENSIKNHWNATKRRLNAKRKRSKRKATKGGRCPPSILQDYIRSNSNTLDEKLKACITKTTPSNYQIDRMAYPQTQYNPSSLQEDTTFPFIQKILEQSQLPHASRLEASGIIRFDQEGEETHHPCMHDHSLEFQSFYDDECFLPISDLCSQCMLMPPSAPDPLFSINRACYQPAAAHYCSKNFIDCNNINGSSTTHLYSEYYPSYLLNIGAPTSSTDVLGSMDNVNSEVDHLKPQASSLSSNKRDLDLVEMVSLQFSSSRSSSSSSNNNNNNNLNLNLNSALLSTNPGSF